MNLTDYEPTAAVIDDTPRPKASQAVAAAKRAQQQNAPTHKAIPAPAAPIAAIRRVRPQQLLIGIVGVLSIIGVFALAVSQLTSAPARPLVTPAPTDAPSSLLTAPTAVPAPSAEPTATIAPTATLVPTEAALAISAEPPQSGRGLTLDQQAPDPTDPPAEPEPTAAPSYIDNVGAQAPHSPRSGLCGPTSGDCAPGVPAGIDNNLYIANVGAQAPHKVR